MSRIQSVVKDREGFALSSCNRRFVGVVVNLCVRVVGEGDDYFAMGIGDS